MSDGIVFLHLDPMPVQMPSEGGLEQEDPLTVKERVLHKLRATWRQRPELLSACSCLWWAHRRC